MFFLKHMYVTTILHDKLCSSINKASDCLYHFNPTICQLLHSMMYHGSVFHFQVNPVTFLLVTELMVTGLTSTGSHISFVLITVFCAIDHTLLRSVLRYFSLSRVCFVWLSYRVDIPKSEHATWTSIYLRYSAVLSVDATNEVILC